MKYIVRSINDYRKKELNDFYSKLSIDDKTKIDKISNSLKKKQSIIGRILLNELLNNEYNLNYYDLTIYYNEYGKPYIKDKNIFFNISHSYDYVVCAISNKEIGIDIEKVREINPNNIKWFATSKEKKYIKDSYERAFNIYTLKESYFKLLGTNLNNILDVEFNIDNKISINKDNIKCTIINDIDNYIISVCEYINNF